MSQTSRRKNNPKEGFFRGSSDGFTQSPGRRGAKVPKKEPVPSTNVKNSSIPSNSSESNRENLPERNSSLMHDRTMWLLVNLTGKVVEAQVKSGDIYEGVLHTVTTEKGLGAVLKMARKQDPAETSEKKVIHTTRPIETLIIFPADLIQIHAKDINFEVYKDREFGTDTDISGHHGIRERELQPWMPDEADMATSSLNLNLENPQKSWDQFETNKMLFGVQTSYEEEIYTTSLDRNSDFYRRNLAEAEKIASEIENKVSSNLHLAEERNQALTDDSGIDEEDRYSTVIRKDTVSQLDTSKYIPPQKRAAILATSGKKSNQTSDKKEETMKEEDTKNKMKSSVEPKESSKATKPVELKDPEVKETEGTSEPKSEEKPSDIQDQEKEKAIELMKEKGNELGKEKVPKDKLLPSLEKFTLDRSNSSDNIRTPKSPRSPLQTALTNERLRLRWACVNEKFKNSAPVSPSPTLNRSPLQSPLIGNARNINALSLDPSTPNVPESVLKDFMDFSLNQKKREEQSRRNQLLDDLKSFSKSLETKGLSKKQENTSPETESSATGSEQPSTPTSEAQPQETPTEGSKGAPAESKEVSKEKQAPKEVDKSKPSLKASKLNPNARSFKPMSASAPVFTPSGSGSAPAEGSVAQDPAFYRGYSPEEMYLFTPGRAPFYGYPPLAVPLNPQAIPRVVSYYPQYSQPLVYPPPGGQIPPSSGAPPPKRGAPPASSKPTPTSPNQNAAFYMGTQPGAYFVHPSGVLPPQPGQPFYDSPRAHSGAAEPGEPKETNGPSPTKFQVPNTDSLPVSDKAQPSKTPRQ